MKISAEWIQDFVELPDDIADRDLAERITLGVCEIEGYERRRSVLSDVTVASVTAVEPHPDADKLTLATVDLGAGRSATVVCGAPNCRTGIRVPYAPIGTTLPVGFTLEPKTIRGVRSEGMLCAEDELGLSDDHEGLMELPEDAPVGVTLAEALGRTEIDDLVLDVDNKSLTHRPDCWGHYGLAREFAAVFSKPFMDRFDSRWSDGLKARIAADGGEAPVTIHVDPDSANRGFLGLSVDGVRIGESPDWMQRRLEVAGMRPINSIVDISNYVMLETGIPNHIFDRTTIRGGRIVVRRAGREMEFTTLDEQTRRILPSDTMVCDAEAESAIAGIMGGLESSVAGNTDRIMIEVANWTDAEIRRTSTRLGLRTDASQRYEKSLDSCQLEKALLRIYELVVELNPEARAVGGIQADNMPEPTDLVIETSPSRVAAVLGEDVGEDRFTEILESLGFAVEVAPGASDRTHRIHVPTWRATKDVECEADIVEEIGRIIGYDAIRPESPAHDIEALRLSPAKVMFRRIQDYMVLRGRALQVMTYPMVGEALLDRADWPIRNENLVLANALTPEHNRMRPSMIPSLLAATAENRKEHDAFRLFETGRSYADLGGEAFSADLHQLGVVFLEPRVNPFGDLADVVEGLLDYLSLPGQLLPGDPAQDHPLVPASWSGSHPHEFLDLRIMGRSRGVVFSVHPQIARAFKIKGRAAVAVLDLTEVMNREAKDSRSFTPLDRFPGSVFDVTVVTPADRHAADVAAVVERLKITEIREVSVLDVFDLGDGTKALTLHLVFRDREKTLDAAVLKNREEAVVRALEEAGYPLRA